MIKRNGKASVQPVAEQLNFFDFFRSHEHDEEHISDQRLRPDGRASLERIPSKNGARIAGSGEIGGGPYEAQERTLDELMELEPKLEAQGLTTQQARDQAWEVVRERYIFLPPEDDQGN